MAKVWSGVTIAIQSALSSAQAMSAITKANPAVVTYVGADTFANGDYVYLSNVQGMFQLDQYVARVANVNTAANTLELEGVDSAAFDTFSSGSIQQITFGTTLSGVTDWNVSGGEFEEIDITTIADLVRVIQLGVASSLKFTGTAQWDPSSTALQALKTATASKARRAIRITFADASKWVTTGFVGVSLVPTGSAQQLVTTPITITANANASQAYST